MKVSREMSKFNVNTLRAAGAAALLAAGGAANAAAVDVTAVTTDIGAQIASVVAIGAGVLLVMVAVKAFRWVRSALS
jgi:hypothetical protein